MIPLIPTALHLTAIILGVKVGEQRPLADSVGTASGLGSVPRKAGMLAGLMTAAAISGSILFVSTSKKNLAEFAEQKNGAPIKSLPANSESPLPVTAPTTATAPIPHTEPTSVNEALEPPPVLISPAKIDTLPTRRTDSSKHSGTAVIKHKQLQKMEPDTDQSTAKKTGGVRYINLNE